MKFFEVLKKRKILFLNIFLFIYIAIHLFSGDRGLLSYFDKKNLEKDLTDKKISLTKQIDDFEKKNLLLSENLNYDYIDTLIRDKFKFGKKDEILIKINE
tara:strand:+ start:1196 stop:1495 length:300 start_codon:yes stop_codon:yes gene_type:complete